MRESFINYPLKSLINKKIKCFCKQEHFVNAEIFYGDFLKNLTKVVKILAPYAKIAIICKNKSFLSIGKQVVEKLKEIGNIPLNVIVEDETVTVEKVSTLYALPEDVRLVITFDSELMPMVSYFAQTKNIPIMFIPTSIVVKGVLTDTVSVKVGEKQDEIKVSVKKHVIIDEKIISTEDISTLYVNALGGFIDFFDYKVGGIIHAKKTCSDSAYCFNEATLQIIGNLGKKNKTLKLVEEQLKLDVMNAYTNNAFANSSYKACVELLENFKVKEEVNLYKLNLIFCLLEVYKLYFSKDFGLIPFIPDYNKRAEELSNLTKESQTSIIKRQKDALSNFFTYENRLKKHMNRLKKQVQALLKHKNRFFAVYKVFSKDDIKIDFSIIKKCIFYAPDHVKEYSTVSLLRENGILEI